jgi:hypothetical protein
MTKKIAVLAGNGIGPSSLGFQYSAQVHVSYSSLLIGDHGEACN